MYPFVSVTLFLVLLAIGLLHFYWAAGGTWALAGAMPPAMQQTVDQPGRRTGFRAVTVIVGLGLVLMGVFALLFTSGELPAFVRPYRPWIALGLAGVFAFRAVGDFREVGIFARKREDHIFFVRDRTIYSPLCLTLAVLWAALYWLAG